MAEIISRQNVALVDELERTWYEVTADAVTRTELGDAYADVMERAVKKLADSGLDTIDYRSGVRCSIDAATRRHVVTQANQARNSMLMDYCDQYGWDLVFTSAHFGARPDHATWQGKVFSRSGGTTKYPALIPSTGYGTVTGLCGANCRHEMTPYIPGYSELPDTDFTSQEAYFGMTSDEYYAATQVQRRLERNVRKLKRRVSLGQEAGLDMTADRARLGVAQGKVRDWCKTHKLPRDYARERAWGVKKQPRALGIRMGSAGKAQKLKRSQLRKIKGEHSIEQDARAVNPRYGKGAEYVNNCQRCCPAYEMRRRGYDVMATPVPMGDDGIASYDLLANKWWRAYEDPDVIRPRGRGLSAIEKSMEEWGDGARAQISVTWKIEDGSGVSGHVFMAERVNGKTVFVDPQSGRVLPPDVFDHVTSGLTNYARVDNLEFSKAAKRTLKQRGTGRRKHG